MDGVTTIAESTGADLKMRLPKQRKTQRGKLALLVATMLDVRSANLVELSGILSFLWIFRYAQDIVQLYEV